MVCSQLLLRNNATCCISFLQCSLSRCKLQGKLPVYPINRASQVALVVKNPHADVADIRVCLSCRRSSFHPWPRKIPWRRKWQPTPVFLAEESHGQNSLANNLLTRFHHLTLLLSLSHALVIYKITLELDQALCWLWAWPYKRYGCIHGKLKKSKKEKYRSGHFSTLK